jgi:hypothetical protein
MCDLVATSVRCEAFEDRQRAEVARTETTTPVVNMAAVFYATAVGASTRESRIKIATTDASVRKIFAVTFTVIS